MALIGQYKPDRTVYAEITACSLLKITFEKLKKIKSVNRRKTFLAVNTFYDFYYFFNRDFE